MKGIILLTLTIILSSFNSLSKLKVIVNNVKVGQGSIVVEVYANEKTFFKKSITSKSLKAKKERLEFNFELKNGTYAIAVYQDANENHLLDLNIVRIPTEAYGLSNNFTPVLSAPTFDDCKFIVKNQTTISIDLK